MIMGFSVLGYSSVSFILSSSSTTAPLEAEIIKSLRKVLSIVISFVLFPKALNWKYIVGFIAVLRVHRVHLLPEGREGQGQGGCQGCGGVRLSDASQAAAPARASE